MSDDFCTCGLEWRIRLRTEMEMHNAWRKRAEEAEAAALHKEGAGGARDSEGSEMYWSESSKPQPKGLVAYKCPNCDCLINVAFHREADIRKRVRIEALWGACGIVSYYFDTHRGQEITLEGCDLLLERLRASSAGKAEQKETK